MSMACGTCSEKFKSNNKKVSCFGCKTPHHQKCSSLPKETFDLVCNGDVIWLCSTCKGPFKNLMEKVCGLQKDLDDIKENVLEHEKRLKNLEAGKQTCNAIGDTVKELELREHKSRNIIVKGLEEADNEDSEMCRIESLLSDLGTELKRDNIERTFRIKKKSENDNDDYKNYNRPVIVRFKTVDDKDAVLKNSRNAMNFPKYKNVYINRDLTQMESEELFNLRQKAKKDPSLVVVSSKWGRPRIMRKPTN